MARITKISYRKVNDAPLWTRGNDGIAHRTNEGKRHWECEIEGPWIFNDNPIGEGKTRVEAKGKALEAFQAYYSQVIRAAKELE